MFRSVKKKESFIPVDLEEPLTGEACSQLVIEIVKYIMYQKQQIPLSYDSLIKLYTNSKPFDRNFSSMQSLVNSMSNVTDHMALQFSLNDCDVKEIIIVIGATIVSPKLCIRLELPEDILCSKTHIGYQHSVRKPLLNVMRSILESSEFQEEMTVPLGPTNTFVLVNKRDNHKISEFFIPKPQFTLSQTATSFRIRLSHSASSSLNCNCKSLVKIHHDSFNGHCLEDDEQNIIRKSISCDSDIPYQWYQSRDVFKGFKFLR